MAILPVLLLLVGSLALVVAQARLPRMNWMVALIVAVVVWGTTLGLVAAIPTASSLSVWRPIELFGSTLELKLDLLSWRYVFCTLTGLVSIVLMALAHPVGTRREIHPFTLVFPALAALAMMAGNLLTVAMAWALMDIAAFLYSMKVVEGGEGTASIVVRMAVDGGGVLLVLVAALANRAAGGEKGLGAAITSPWAMGFLASAVTLRLGLLPPHFSLPALSGGDRGIATLMRVLPPAAALCILARQFSYGLTEVMRVWLGLAGLAGLLAGGILSATRGEGRLIGRRLVIAVSGIGVLGASLSQGDPGMPVAAAGAMLVLVGVVVSLGDIHSPWHRLAPGFAMLMVGGLPGGPGMAYVHEVAEGLMQLRTIWLPVGGVLGLILLAAALLGRALREAEGWPPVEEVARAVYGLGLLLPLAAGMLLGAWTEAGIGMVDAIVFVIVVGLASGAAILLRRLPREGLLERKVRDDWLGASRMLGGLQRIGSLVMGAARGVGRLLEGEGGMLWLYAVLLGLVLAMMRGMS